MKTMCRNAGQSIRTLAGVAVLFGVMAAVKPAAAALVFGGNPGTCTVYLDANGGTVSPTVLTVDTRDDNSPSGAIITLPHYHGTLGDLPTPEFEGRSFLGWFTARDGGDWVGKGTTVHSSSSAFSVTYYAHWQLIAYTVTFDANGGSVSAASRTVNHGEAIGELPTARRTGYTFSGWCTAKSGGEKIASSYGVTKDLTFYAQWKPISFAVTFDAYGGNVTTASKSVLFDDVYGSLPTPTRTGYTFDGWYTAANGGTKVKAGTCVTTAADHWLYARWAANIYTVRFDANGGSVSPDAKQVRYGGTYGTLPLPIREDYASVGWFTAAKGGVEVTARTNVTRTADHALFAHWSPILTNACLVVMHRNYDGRYGDVTAERVVKVGANGRLPTVAELGWTRPGVRFLGWVSGKGKSLSAFTDGQDLQSLSVVPGTTNILYAGWR